MSSEEAVPALPVLARKLDEVGEVSEQLDSLEQRRAPSVEKGSYRTREAAGRVEKAEWTVRERGDPGQAWARWQPSALRRCRPQRACPGRQGTAVPSPKTAGGIAAPFGTPRRPERVALGVPRVPD